MRAIGLLIMDVDSTLVKEEVIDYIQRLSLALENQINNLYNNNF